MEESNRRLWEERIREQENSGLTIIAWCSQHKIAKQSYYYWRKKLKQEPCASALSVFAEPELKQPAADSPHQAPSGLSITWENAHFTISDSDDIQLAVQFIRQLKML